MCQEIRSHFINKQRHPFWPFSSLTWCCALLLHKFTLCVRMNVCVRAGVCVWVWVWVWVCVCVNVCMYTVCDVHNDMHIPCTRYLAINNIYLFIIYPDNGLLKWRITSDLLVLQVLIATFLSSSSSSHSPFPFLDPVTTGSFNFTSDSATNSLLLRTSLVSFRWWNNEQNITEDRNLSV